MRIYSSISELFWSLIICNLVMLAAVIIFCFGVYPMRKKQPFVFTAQNTRLLLTLFYLVSVISITIVPVPFTRTARMEKINFVPFLNTAETLFAPLKRGNRLLAYDVVENIIGNIIMFIPFGIFVPTQLPKTATWKRMFLLSVSASAFIEFMQLLSRLIGNYRQVDIDDVIFNTLGALMGYLIYKNFFGKNRSVANAEPLFT